MQLQTITEDYLKLNSELHAVNTSYGSWGWRHSQKILDLRDSLDCDTVLDYGCGKGSLKNALDSPEWVREYDPAIPGKDARPELADLVICTDVLEHIEPELLDNVLTDILRLTGKAAFLVVATRPAQKTLADGTNAHKIIENAEWWRAKLSEKFYVLTLDANGPGEFSAVVSPIRMITEVKGKSAVSDTIRFENAQRNCGVVKGRVLGSDLVPRHDGRVCIVGFGPTLRETWPYLKVERRAFGAKIVSVSGAHDFLIERGIVPDCHVEVDPREHKCFFTRNPHPDVTYQIASCCHPKLIDNLIANGSKLELWHLLNSDEDAKIHAHDGPDPGSLLIAGGSGVGARAVHLRYALGYRSFSVYGIDSSFGPSDGAQHAGEHTGKVQKEWNVRVGGRWFRSSAALVYMARGFIASCKTLERMSAENGEPCISGSADRVEFFMHGDGLLQQMVMEGNRLGEAA